VPPASDSGEPFDAPAMPESGSAEPADTPVPLETPAPPESGAAEPAMPPGEPGSMEPGSAEIRFRLDGSVQPAAVLRPLPAIRFVWSPEPERLIIARLICGDAPAGVR
jgi:hypothetical protein